MVFDISERLCDHSRVWSFRSVAQPGRAQPSGGWGRRFESSHSDQFAEKAGNMKNSLSKKVIVSVSVVTVMLLGAIGYEVFSPEVPEIKETPQSVIVSKATFGSVEKYINTIGSLVPCDSVDIKSEVNAKVDQIHFSDGSIVKKGDLLIQFDESLAKAEVSEAEARYRKAKIEYESLNKLADRGAAAKIKKEQAYSEMLTTSAQLNFAKVKLEKHKILAPFGGMIGIRHISVGQFIQSGMDLVKLVDNHPLKVDFTVAEVDIDKIYVSQEISIYVGGDAFQSYSAKISAIEPESDKVSHSFKVRAILDVPEEIAVNSQTLKPGRFVKVRITVNDGEQGIIIPESAIEKSGNESMVYIVSDGMAIRRLITPGMRKDGNVEVITGINEGDLVITKGKEGVSDGRAVKIRDEYSSSEIINAYKEYYGKNKATTRKK